MARPLRIEYPGAVHHVMSRGIDGQPICINDTDRHKWLKVLAETVERFSWEVLAFCLLDNHYHLFLQTPECGLSRGMRQLNGVYAGYFNWRHERRGPLMQGRFKSILVEDESYWLELSRYVHLNPVRAGLCSRPEEWPWSSYRGYHTATRRVKWVAHDRVLAEFGRNRTRARTAYCRFVEEGLDREIDDPLKAVSHGFILGCEEFVERILEMVDDAEDDQERPSLKSLKREPDLHRLTEAVCAELGADRRAWQPGSRARDDSRALCAFVLRETSRASLKEIAQALGYRRYTSAGSACDRAAALMKDPALRRKVEAVVERVRLNG